MVAEKELTTQNVIQEKAVIIERHLHLVANATRKYKDTGVNALDLISIGIVGLVKAINALDNMEQSDLSEYLSNGIENEITIFLSNIGGSSRL